MSFTDSGKDTATRILDAAEVLFVEFGFEATSLRMITQRAAVNLAAVNYHFGSKEVLYQGVVSRRLAPYNQECIEELQRMQADAGGPLPIDAVVAAFLRPAIRLSRDPARGGIIFIRLMSRAFAEPHDALREILPKLYSDVLETYRRALSSALPELSNNEVLWRLQFAMGTIFYAFAGNDVTRMMSLHNVPGARDPQEIVRQLTPYVVAGLSAPPVRQ
ncbi:MAG: TetR/AcrR family transcriptional regulator [Chitinivorax sp.]|mgnify:FL=1